MKKALMVANVASMIDQFNASNIKVLKSLGYEVHVAANFEQGNTTSEERIRKFKEELKEQGIEIFQLPIVRHFGIDNSNLKAYRILKEIINKNNYDLIHCHSPIGGMLTRLAARKARKNGTKVISTAHGFLFYKGAPLKRWLIYYPIERFLAIFTDVLITINKEDYCLAKRFKARKIVYVPGIGVDSKKFDEFKQLRSIKRNDLGIDDSTVVLLSVGEFIRRKNHETIIKAISNLELDNFVYILCGRGELQGYLENLAKKLQIEDKIKFLGYRRDIPEICAASDIFLFPSFQEGLPVAVMEAMCAGLPVICSNIRGNTDLIEDSEGGYLVEPDNVSGFSGVIEKVIRNTSLRNKMGEYNKKTIINFDIKNVEEYMSKIYFEA